MNSNGEKSNGGNGSGFTQIPNIIMDAVCRCVQGGAEGQVMWAILRRLYGYHVSAAHISIGQLVAATGLSRRAVIYALKNLEVKNIITVRRQKTESYNAVNVIAILDTTLWRTNGKGKSYAATLRKQKAKSAQKKLRPSPNQATTSAPAPAEAPTADAEKLADKICRPLNTNRTDADAARMQKLLDEGHSEEEISAMIDWAQSDSFWCNIIKNTSTFERNYAKMLERAGGSACCSAPKEYKEEKIEPDGTELVVGSESYTYCGGFAYDARGNVIPSGMVSALIRQGKAQVRRSSEVVGYVN